MSARDCPTRVPAKDHLPALLLFCYGALVHLFAFRRLVERSFPPPSPRTFPDHCLTNITVALLGGVVVTGVMLPLFRRLSQRDGTRGFSAIRSFSVICKASLSGMLATLLTVEIFYVLVSLFATSWAAGDARASGIAFPLVWGLLLSLIEVQTYGFEAVIFGVPFGLAQGALCGVLFVISARVFRR